jgi:hypothetical protein
VGGVEGGFDILIWFGNWEGRREKANCFWPMGENNEVKNEI